MHWAALTSFVGVASAYIQPFNPVQQAVTPRLPGDTSTAGHGKLEFFDQLIDHSNPSLGTFKQRYWWNTDHYGGPHSPIVLESPGEAAVGTDGDLSNMGNSSLPGLLAQDNQGAYIIIEHRYFGPSTPFTDLNTETLQHMTLDNAVQDLIYFAKNVVFPFDTTNGTATKPDQAPWLLSGCSYSGALSAWTQSLAPGTFWAYEAGSAVVQTVEQFWEYYAPIKNSMPKNCTADFQRIIKHTDDVLIHGNDTAKKTLKDKFALGNYTDKEFANVITNWITVQQSHQAYRHVNDLTLLCDFVENQRPTKMVPVPGPDGVGLELALDGLARVYTNTTDKVLAGVKARSGVDWRSLNGRSDIATTEINPWTWFLCNEPFEWWQSWSRFDNTGFQSRLWSWKDDIHGVCDRNFPDKNGFQYGLKAGRTYHGVNKHTGGWRKVDTKRLVWINGEFDPWRPATVSWEGRPGGALESTEDHPVYVIKNAGHCNDYVAANAGSVEGKAIFEATLGHFRKWVAEFYEEHPHAK
ncbi:hypothetical protein VHEMI10243 [[Torrubiella] hemipterigena]|uniref:Peptidase S28 n=1 Tax=[Torrubiella] hemipterigena TaxID=1531966 RepID=A0A0A1TT05_9HYPO|nr:hypothetical protein VHEMI10243 [[Torrubiella] hemipterigena]